MPLYFRIILACFGLFLSGICRAQRPVNTAAFLGSSVEEVAAFPPAGENDSSRMPWFDKVELRTETRDFDFAQQEYTLRLTPSTPGRRKAQTQLWKLRQETPDFGSAKARCEVITDRHLDWIKLYELTRTLHFLRRLDSIFADEATVLNRMNLALEADWARMVDLKQDRTELKLRMYGVEEELLELKQWYGITEALPDFDDLIKVEDLVRNLSSTQPVAVPSENDFERREVLAELRLRRADDKQYLDFAQVRYRGPHDDPAVERFSVGVGLQLPGNGDGKLKEGELLAKERLLRAEMVRDSIERSQDRRRFRMDLAAEGGAYSFAARQFTKERAELADLAATLMRREGYNPLPLLKIKRREVTNELRLLSLRADVYERAVKTAESLGVLCRRESGSILLAD